MAGDNPPYDGQQEVKPPPAVTKYPSFLNAIFDHDWVDFGPDKIRRERGRQQRPAAADQAPLPRRRHYVDRRTLNVWVILQEVVFEPGTDLPNLPAFDPALGYPSVTVFQTSSPAGSATPPIQPVFTDVCTPVWSDQHSPGVTSDNPDTPANEGGLSLRTLPSQPGTQVTSIFYAFSQRDADRDGYENTIDPCPFHADWVWNPRDMTQPSRRRQRPVRRPASPDGIPDTCDPTPDRADRGRQISPRTTTVTASRTGATTARCTPTRTRPIGTETLPARRSATASAMSAIRREPIPALTRRAARSLAPAPSPATAPSCPMVSRSTASGRSRLPSEAPDRPR